MARRKNNTTSSQPGLTDYRHDSATRKNNPPAKIAAEGVVPVIPKAQYHYSPRRPPVLRFDPNGGPDALPDLLAKATRGPLTAEEAKLLADALRNNEPWLEWAAKREQQERGFEVDPVALHIHERVSAQAILKVAARQDVQRSLFADPQQDYHEAVQFYKHDVDWANRLILGDSLAVMSSLARREDLAGRVQMIYMDPPYGIKFASNFQPEVGKRDVKDKEQDLTREPEMVRAYRDTWHLGIHSYLSYLRDRLIVAKELLADAGSIFVQISAENLQRVTLLLDDVFGVANRISVIAYRTSSPLGASGLPTVCDFLLWYARDGGQSKFRQTFGDKDTGQDTEYVWLDTSTGERRRMSADEKLTDVVRSGERVFARGALYSSGFTPSCIYEFEFDGARYATTSKSWRTNRQGMERLIKASRLVRIGALPYFVQYHDDFSVQPLNNLWTDTRAALSKAYVVETSFTVIERCMLMTTDPGDLVLDPTCGSGTTAYVAEQWGRRWITTDTSRVAIAIARQRLLTAKYDYYKLKPPPLTTSGTVQQRLDGSSEGLRQSMLAATAESPALGLVYKTVPHVTLKSIAQNTNLDPIFARHEPILEKALAACNAALIKVTPELRKRLGEKLAAKQRNDGKKAITDADRRRWELPQASSPKSQASFEHWTVPFDTDAEWPKELAEAVTAYRKAWRAKMDEVNACIAANAEQEELVDQPDVVRGVVRVSGPFTVEAVQPPEMSLGENIDPRTSEPGRPDREFDGAPESLPESFEARTLRIVEPRPDMDAKNVEAYLDQMIRYLRMDGVRFPNNKQMSFTRLEPLWQSGRSGMIHAEGNWAPVASNGSKGASSPAPSKGEVAERANVAVSFGPQYGPVTAKMVEECVRSANRADYQSLVIAAFSFDGPSQAVIEEVSDKPQGRKVLTIHAAHIRPDVNPAMNGLLKDQPGSQLFTVFGQPRTRLDGPDKDGMYTITMEGVDIYNPVENSIAATGADKVAAWFLDSDYDGWTFCITQAFFPDKTAWDKLSRALNGPGGVIDEERFAALSGTVSLPFAPGKHKCAAVKVIDPRGNEVMKVERLN